MMILNMFTSMFVLCLFSTVGDPKTPVVSENYLELI